MPNTNTHNAKINAYYNSPAVLFFEQVTRQQIHLGYWDDSNPQADMAQATEHLTQVVIDQIDVPPNARLLDIGCGCGIPAIEIAKQKGCQVDGITINPQQQAKAAAWAAQAGLSNKVTFCVGDACKLPYEDRHFNSTILLESIHHIGHEEALREAWRVLKPGGTILIADGVVLHDDVADADQRLLAETFVAKSLLKESELLAMLNQNGFDSIEITDLTNATQPSWIKLFEATSANKATIVKENTVEFYEALLDFWCQMASIWSQNAKYLIIKARKSN